MVCEICGKPPSPYPNWILSKGHGYHVGCLAQDYAEVKVAHKMLFDRCWAMGWWGVWSDDWEGSYEQRHWGAD